MASKDSREYDVTDDTERLIDDHHPPKQSHLHRRTRLSFVLETSIIVLLALSNLITILTLFRTRTVSSETHPGRYLLHCKYLPKLAHSSNLNSACLESQEGSWQPMHTYTEFSSFDRTTANKAWDSYTINGFVALPNSWLEDRHQPLGRPMPGDPEKGIYVVDGFHQLHCLVSPKPTAENLKLPRKKGEKKHAHKPPFPRCRSATWSSI